MRRPPFDSRQRPVYYKPVDMRDVSQVRGHLLECISLPIQPASVVVDLSNLPPSGDIVEMFDLLRDLERAALVVLSPGMDIPVDETWDVGTGGSQLILRKLLRGSILSAAIRRLDTGWYDVAVAVPEVELSDLELDS